MIKDLPQGETQNYPQAGHEKAKNNAMTTPDAEELVAQKC